jgi:hypothetical protein
MSGQTSSNLAPSQPALASNKMQTWSDREDRALQSTYEHYRKGCHKSAIDLDDDEIWELVATGMESRTPVQCLLRYMKLTQAFNTDAKTNRISEIDCTVATEEIGGKRDYDDYKSPSSASTCSTGSSRKRFKHNDSCGDWTEEETERLEEFMLQYQDGGEYFY